MQALTRAIDGIATVTPAGWSLVGGSIFSGIACCCLATTQYQKAQIREAQTVSIFVTRSGKLMSINGKRPTTCEEYLSQLVPLSARYPLLRARFSELTTEFRSSNEFLQEKRDRAVRVGLSKTNREDIQKVLEDPKKSPQEVMAALKQINDPALAEVITALEGAITGIEETLVKSFVTTHKEKETKLGRLVSWLNEITTSDFAKQVKAAEKPDAPLSTQLYPYRHEIGCLLAALPFYGAFGYFLAAQRAALRAAVIPGINI